MPLVKSGARAIRVALINNMPDLVLQDTESQFIRLLNDASGEIPVRLKLFSLPHIPRGDAAGRRISQAYEPFESLWESPFDAVIVTGTEPRQPDLRQEPYWPALSAVLDWAEENTTSAVLSCLAAHAGVLHADGIAREPLPEKQFGVFAFPRTREHPLTRHAAAALTVPHSRWNALAPQSLKSCGYNILAESAQAGVDLFVKQRKKSLFVHFQGHPEYESDTLLMEYRRDVKRFLRGARDTYPSQPQGYFDAAAGKVLDEFRKSATARTSDAPLVDFPQARVTRNLKNTWRSAATNVYRNWLHSLALAKHDARSSRVVLSLDHV